MNDILMSLKTIIKKVAESSETSLELVKLKTLDRSADIISSFLVKIAILMMVFICLTLLNVGLSLWIGEFLGTIYFGFYIVSLAYGLLSLLLGLYFKTYLKTSFSNFIIKLIIDSKSS